MSDQDDNNNNDDGGGSGTGDGGMDAQLRDSLDASYRDISAVMNTGDDDDDPGDNDDAESNAMDWILSEYDKNSSDAQNLNDELKRLQALRSYLVLDSEREFPFERLTGLASRLFNVPIALVSLVDLGRQWFMSNRGLGDVRETPRSQAFCAHAIISTEDLFIIQDASKDFRFKNNPLVTGAPNIRFYAGTPLRTPEGYKIGTFCIIDSIPRPNGLSFEEKQNLQELGALAVQVLVQRRMRRDRNRDKNSQLVACAAHDLLTPLSGIELSLNLLLEDESLQKRLNVQQQEGLKKAVACSNVLQDICKNVRSTFSESKSAFELSFIQGQLKTFKPDEMVENLYTIVDPLPKKVPVAIKIDDDVPKEMISDFAKIFRCAMIYLTVACARTQEGAIVMRIRTRPGSKNQSLLYVSCEDTSPPIPVDCYESLFKPMKSDLGLIPRGADSSSEKQGEESSVNAELALYSVACQMNVVGGEFGFHPRGSTINDEDLTAMSSNEEGNGQGSVFWFSIPYSLDYEREPIETKPPEANVARPQEEDISYADASQFQKSVSTAMGEEGTERSITKNPTVKRQQRALVIEDSHVVRKMLARIFTRLGYGVTEAENGLDGLVELKGSLYDIVLCDFLMPALDGLDCVQQYREWENLHRPWLKQWIIGISAHASEADIEKGLKVGMNRFMPKPVTYAGLSNLIKSDDQISMSKRLDELEEQGGEVPSGDESAGDSLDHRLYDNKRRKRSNSSDSKYAERVKACLILSPYTTHIGMVQSTIKNCRWQSALGQTDREAWSMLKMRMWDLVLVDDSFTPLVVDFRKWESSRRKKVQRHIILMSESVNNVAEGPRSVVQPPEGFNEVVGKPFGFAAVKKALKSMSRELAQEKKAKALFATS